MSRFVFFVLLISLLVLVTAAMNSNAVEAGQPVEFIQVSVLAEQHANYAVDESFKTIPPVSVAIIEDTVRDRQANSSVPIITYTSLPVDRTTSKDQDNDASETVEDSKPPSHPSNDQGPGTPPENGNSQTNENAVNGYEPGNASDIANENGNTEQSRDRKHNREKSNNKDKSNSKSENEKMK